MKLEQPREELRSEGPRGDKHLHSEAKGREEDQAELAHTAMASHEDGQGGSNGGTLQKQAAALALHGDRLLRAVSNGGALPGSIARGKMISRSQVKRCRKTNILRH